MRAIRIVIAASVFALFAAVLFPAVLFPASAVAQPKESKPKVKVYDFSGDTIEGDLIKPEGTSVDARDFAKHTSLIRIRTNFIAEILKSAEDL